MIFTIVDDLEGADIEYKVERGQATLAIIDKTGDIDIRDEQGAFLDEDAEDSPGADLFVNKDDDNDDGIIDRDNGSEMGQIDDDLVEVNFRSLVPQGLNFAADYFSLSFDETSIRVWHNQDKSIDGSFDKARVFSSRDFNPNADEPGYTIFDESIRTFTVWVEGLTYGANQLKLIWHETIDNNNHLQVDSVAYKVWEGKREILAAVDGTNSREWLGIPDRFYGAAVPNEDFPEGQARTLVKQRYLSHVRSFHDDYGSTFREYWHGPNTGGTNAIEIRDSVYEWVEGQYFDAMKVNEKPYLDFVGHSRGATIVIEVARLLELQGLTGELDGQQVNHANVPVRFLGSYDAVDMSLELRIAGDRMPGNVKNGYMSQATNFPDEIDVLEISRYYWNRVVYDHLPASNRLVTHGTHSAHGGGPTYSTDTGEPTSLGDQRPVDWLAGYSDELDIEASIAVDRWMRGNAKSAGVPVSLLSAAEYDFDNLLDIGDAGGDE